MSPKRETLIGLTVFTFGTLASGVAVSALLASRRWLNWGASEDEVARKLPGDDLLPDAGLVSTRAVTVSASPDDVWPWLVQMGSGRGGAYTYDWIENLFGLGMHSASEVLPQFQDLAAGQEVPMGAGKYLRVEVLDPRHALVVRSTDQRWVWIFALVEGDAGATRLISRNRIATAPMPAAARLFYRQFMVPGSLVMERKMLLGIKQRAERLAATRPPGPGLPR